MKKVKKLPKMKQCPVGHRAEIGNDVRSFYVICSKYDCLWAFDGLYRTRREAILAWNKRA